MKIIEVNTPQTINDFLKLPKKIYQNDKNWIPHLKQDIEKVFNPKRNKAHAKGKIIRWILKDNNQQTIGRVAAFIEGNSTKGGIGFFECINDSSAANELFTSSINWLKNNNAELMDGSINFGEKHMFWGVLVDNFTDPNSYSMNYNPPYYAQLFEDFGFQVYYKQFMYKRSISADVQEVFLRKYKGIINDPDYRIASVRGLSLDEIAVDFRTAYNAAWGGIAGFDNMTLKTAQKIMANLKPVYDPDIMIFAYYKNVPIACYINIPELNEIFKYVNGNLNLLGKLTFLFHKLKKTPKTMVGIVFGVAKEFQGKGIDGAMINWTQQHLTKKGQYSETVLTWVGDFNPKMIKICENLDAEVYRTYHTYRYLFDRNQVFERCPIL